MKRRAVMISGRSRSPPCQEQWDSTASSRSAPQSSAKYAEVMQTFAMLGSRAVGSLKLTLRVRDSFAENRQEKTGVLVGIVRIHESKPSSDQVKKRTTEIISTSDPERLNNLT
jgi:hypothetical protein